jgi:hypothetical protein
MRLAQIRGLAASRQPFGGELAQQLVQAVAPVARLPQQ